MSMTKKYLNLFLGLCCLLSVGTASATDNPCAMKGNPCAAKNPCVMSNPCAAKSDRIDSTKVKRPTGTRLAPGDHAALVKEGEMLWNDTRLSTNGLSCNSCHADHNSFSASFARPYPHKVGMVKERAGIKGAIHLDEMVQFCMMAPMAAQPFPWDSRELAALTAYTAEMQKTYKPGATASQPANPCGAMKNPCAMRGNPCAMKR